MGSIRVFLIMLLGFAILSSAAKTTAVAAASAFSNGEVFSGAETRAARRWLKHSPAVRMNDYEDPTANTNHDPQNRAPRRRGGHSRRPRYP
ncbi:hypothetical protein V2J09_006933 [Rumex salicifolius]